MAVANYITQEQIRTLLTNLKGEFDTKALQSDLDSISGNIPSQATDEDIEDLWTEIFGG